MIENVKYKTDCQCMTHLQNIHDTIIRNMGVFNLNSIQEIDYVIYKTHKVINILLKKN